MIPCSWRRLLALSSFSRIEQRKDAYLRGKDRSRGEERSTRPDLPERCSSRSPRSQQSRARLLPGFSSIRPNLAVHRVIPRTDSPKLTFALADRATHLVNDFRNKDAVRAHEFGSVLLQVPRTKNSQQLATECRFYLDTLPTMATRLLPSGILMNRPGWVSLRWARFLPVTRRDPTSGERTPLLRRRFTPTSPTPLLASSP